MADIIQWNKNHNLNIPSQRYFDSNRLKGITFQTKPDCTYHILRTHGVSSWGMPISTTTVWQKSVHVTMNIPSWIDEVATNEQVEEIKKELEAGENATLVSESDPGEGETKSDTDVEDNDSKENKSKRTKIASTLNAGQSGQVNNEPKNQDKNGVSDKTRTQETHTHQGEEVNNTNNEQEKKQQQKDKLKVKPKDKPQMTQTQGGTQTQPSNKPGPKPGHKQQPNKHDKQQNQGSKNEQQPLRPAQPAKPNSKERTNHVSLNNRVEMSLEDEFGTTNIDIEFENSQKNAETLKDIFHQIICEPDDQNEINEEVS